MQFSEVPLPGAYLVDVLPVNDERGFFARTYSPEEFAAQGSFPQLTQCSTSYNLRKGTLRGMHFQIAPCEEHKLVRCTAGAIFDVIIDMRSSSGHFCGWYATELTADNRRALFIPPGFAHGFLTLTDRTEVLYMISAAYSAGHARGVRWNDPAFGIQWPIEPSVVSSRDAQYPLLQQEARPDAMNEDGRADRSSGS